MRTKFSMDNDDDEKQNEHPFYSIICRRKELFVGTLAIAVISVLLLSSKTSSYHENSLKKRLGPYKLVERQEGREFFDYYSFYDGADSLGSAGYNSYIGKKRALELGLVNVTKDETDGIEYVYMNSAATSKGPRESIRLEGNRRFDRGLFILDLSHMPAGCGVWPAFWLTGRFWYKDSLNFVLTMLCLCTHMRTYFLQFRRRQLAQEWRNRHCGRCELSSGGQDSSAYLRIL